jgi:hypothetical protein
MRAFQIGMDRVQVDNNRAFLIATPEKALADKIATGRWTGIRTLAELKEHLFDNMRIDPNELQKLDLGRLADITVLFGSGKVRLLNRLLNRIKHTKGIA